METEFYCPKCDKYYDNIYKFCPKHGDKLILKAAEDVPPVLPDKPVKVEPPAQSAVISQVLLENPEKNGSQVNSSDDARRISELEGEIVELKKQLAVSQKLANHEASKNEKPTTQTGAKKNTGTRTGRKIFITLIVLLLVAWIVNVVLLKSDWLYQYPALNNYIILVSNYFHSRIGLYLDNFGIEFTRSHPTFTLTYHAIFLLIFSGLVIARFIFLPSLKNDKLMRFFGIFSVILISILTFFQIYSITSWGGIWERQWIIIWDGAWAIYGVFITLLAASLGVFNNGPVHEISRNQKAASIVIVLLFIGIFLAYIHYANQSTSKSIQITANRGWQKVGLSIAKGQTARIYCPNSKWTTNYFDLQKFPKTTPDGYSNFTQTGKNSGKPLVDKPSGMLVAKVGLDEKVYPIGVGGYFKSEF